MVGKNGVLSIKLPLLFCIILFVNCYECLNVSEINPDYLLNQMYTNLWGYPCVSLVGSEGPIGCTTKSNGQYGWIYPVYSQDELETFIKKAPSDPVVIVVPSDIFVKENIDRINPNDIEGILVYRRNLPLGNSPGDKNPNKQYGLYPNSTMNWNPSGNAWNYNIQPFPIFAIDNNTLSYLLPYLEYNKEAKSYPKHAIRLIDNMYTRIDKNVETCLRRFNCAPLGGKNVWALLSPLDQNKEITLAISAMDANAFFHDLAPGADVISGTVSLLAAIEALTHIDQSGFKKQAMFAIFNGEQYGYIGSKAFVNDLQNFKCIEYKNETESGDIEYCHYPFRADLHFTNLTLSQFSSILEFNQVGLLTDEGSLPPVTNYVGTYERSQHNFLTEFVRDWVANATAQYRGIACEKNSNCTGEEECIAGQCLSGFNSFYHDALSPAFEYQYGVGYVIVDDSPIWPQWTESYWDTPYLTVFWIDWPWLGYFVFAFGVIEFIICLIVVFLSIKFIEKHTKKD